MHIDYTEKIAVTGGTGFLGSHIIRGLVERGYVNIYALKRSTSNLDLLSDVLEKITFIDGDILDVMSLQELCADAKYVIHSAAKVSYNPPDLQEVFQVNVEGTANVVNACLASISLKKLLFISSVAAIGRPLIKGLISEETEWDGNQDHSNYGVAKHLAELEVWRGMTEGLTVGVVNPSMILGPSHWGDSSTKIFTYVADQKRFYPTGSNGFVDVRDVAKLSILYMESDLQNERIIAVSEMYSYKKLLAEIATEMNVKSPSKRLSKSLAAILWRLASLQRDPAITKETVRITSGNFEYDNSKTRRSFDFQYRSVKSSIKDTVREFIENKSQNKTFGFFSNIFD